LPALTPVTLPVTRWGSPDAARTALLLHGLTSFGATWWRVADALAAAGFAVTAPDLRGHGRAPHTESYAISDFGGDVLGVEGRWDLVVGHSLGGVVAVAAAHRQPGWARRLLLVDPVITIPADGLDELTEEIVEEIRVPDAAGYLVLNPRWHPEDAALKLEAARATSEHVVRSVLAEPWSYEAQLAEVDCPVIVLAADPDRGATFTAAEGRRLEAAKPDLRWSVVPGAGHSIHRDDHLAVVNAALAE
jgi:pimeloyl-ACP methyl ester carboxylesterase